MNINPLTAIMSLEKTNKCAKFESHFVFFFALACARIFIKTHRTEKKFVIKQENILFLRRVRASFSPEILHDGAVKGLIWFCGLYSFKGETENVP